MLLTNLTKVYVLRDKRNYIHFEMYFKENIRMDLFFLFFFLQTVCVSVFGRGYQFDEGPGHGHIRNSPV